MNIVLASGSPRRRELLASAQLDFSIMSADIDETPYDSELPTDYIERMVAAKATAAIQHLNDSSKSNHSEPFIMLTADTIGVLPDGKSVLVKPTDGAHAYRMWQQMSDSTHEVWTTVQVTQVCPTSQIPLLSKETSLTSTALDGISSNKHTLQIVSQQQITERTKVTFVPLTPDMMAAYWASGEPADKAGGYGIQGLAAAWVTCINGSYTNVVGLPLAQTLALIKSASADLTNTLKNSKR